MRNRRGASGGKVVLLVAVLVILGIFFYVATSDLFEKNPPNIEAKSEIYWNQKEPIAAKISDDSGIINYKLFMVKNGEKSLLKNELLREPQKEVVFNIEPPKVGISRKDTTYEFIIEATDSSKWNMFHGNSAAYKVTVHIDRKRPLLQVLASSYKIVKGGSALIVFKASDENLENLEIKDGEKSYKPLPFYKEGYYASLVTWSVTNDTFDAKIVATDKAGNSAVAPISLYKKIKNYSSSTIKLNDSFIDGKITSLIEEIGADEYLDVPKVEKFKFINEITRANNEKIITNATAIKEGVVADVNFKITPFYPLKNSAAVASFGAYRSFEYSDAIVSNSYHLGLDLASTQNADIISNNDGEVVFADFNGIYGNTVIIHHGFGLHTLYSHCSQLNVTEGQKVAAGQVIAKSGMTGLALGDHLHFGVIVNGIEVRPEEWMDEKWMDESIYSVIETSKKIIDGQIKS